MPIDTQSVQNITTRKNGGIRASLVYAFSDGRSVSVGPISFDSVADATVALSARSADTLKSQQSSDAQEAVELGITTAHKEASQEQVYFAWLSAGYNQEESYKAYLIMASVAPQILAMGLTAQQMADAFGSTLEDAQAVLDRWYYLDSNKLSIQAYQTIKGGDI